MHALSSNARKQQEDDVERLVKCRLRSEIEARKAVEATMKRAVQEARELKKELVLLRQEKEELRGAIQKNVLAAPVSGGKETSRHGSSGRTTSSCNDSSTAKQGSNKAAELKLKQQIQTLKTRNAELETSSQELQQRVAQLESELSTTTAQFTSNVADKDQEIAALQSDLRASKLAADETKRKCQKMLKDKREETQRAIQENEQLARCAKTLQNQLALLPQLKKQLEHAKEKRADVADVWQKKLEQRDQAFLRGEEASKRKLAESAGQIEQLSREKLALQARLEELETKLDGVDQKHKVTLQLEARRFDELESTKEMLREKLLAAQNALRGAEKAEEVARETQQQETQLRQLAEDAADAVEARAEKAEHDLAQAQTQLKRLEEALKTRGVTLDYLLKQQTPVTVASRSPGLDKATKKRTPPGMTRKASASKPVGKARTDLKGQSKTRLKSNNDEE